MLSKLTLTAALGGVLLAGFSAPSQDVMWFLDEDDVVANPKRVCEASEIAGLIVSKLIPHDMGRFRFGNTTCDDGSLSIEDLASIPDLAAGAICELLAHGLPSETPLMSAFPSGLTSKARAILKWCCLSRAYPLKMSFVLLERGHPGKVRVRSLDLHGVVALE